MAKKVETSIIEAAEDILEAKVRAPTNLDLDASLYDETGDRDNLYELETNEDLDPWEIEDADRYRTLARGVMLVTGPPGSGKGLFSHTLAWKLRRYFKGKKVLMDTKPRRVFDEYGPLDNPYILFNAEFMMSELNKMAAKAGTEICYEMIDSDKKLTRSNINKRTEATGLLAEQWRKTHEILLHNSVMQLDELKRYFHNRRPHNPLGIMLGNLLSMWRHYDLLVLGLAPQKLEIDRISFAPYITHHVKCRWDGIRDLCIAKVYKARYVGTRGVVEVAGKPIIIETDGNKPRAQLGGFRYYDLFVSKNVQNLMPASHSYRVKQ